MEPSVWMTALNHTIFLQAEGMYVSFCMYMLKPKETLLRLF